MRALITGGAGFIGSNIVRLLLSKGYDITVLDNLSSGHYINIEEYVKNQGVKFIKADIRDANAVLNACDGQDVIFHLAACVGRQKSLDDPLLDSSTNLLGTVNVLEGMNKRGVNRIVYSSSAAIFGELHTLTIDEDHPQNADSPYGVSKLAAEKMILAYCGIYGISGICLRYFNIYGINQRFDLYGNVIPIFAKRIYSGEPITIFGDGLQTRDFVNVRDVARANFMASACDEGTDVFNLGSGESITIGRLAEIMIDISGKNTKVVYAPERPADVKHCKANTGKVDRVLNFKTEIALENGLSEYMEWYRNNCM